MTNRLQEIQELHQMVVPDHQSEYALIQMAPLLYGQVSALLSLLDAEIKRREAAEKVLNNLIEGGHVSPVRWDKWQQVKAEYEKVVSDANN